ncbi:hypothetical protein CPB86DRAFT_48307 [Serendipita vermifera]|nr:hypothetical protein CPB86DRAFT_48307 [Serendipita vermifera]
MARDEMIHEEAMHLLPWSMFSNLFILRVLFILSTPRVVRLGVPHLQALNLIDFQNTTEFANICTCVTTYTDYARHKVWIKRVFISGAGCCQTVPDRVPPSVRLYAIFLGSSSLRIFLNRPSIESKIRKLSFIHLWHVATYTG